MTLAEVEAILGGPARSEAIDPQAIASIEWETNRVRMPSPGEPRIWSTDDVLIRVELEKGGRVLQASRTSMDSATRKTKTLLERVREWLKL